MLALTRREKQRVRLTAAGLVVWVEVADVRDRRVVLTFEGPREVEIVREEVLRRRAAEDRT